MFNATRADWESTLEDWHKTEKSCFEFKAILPKILKNELRKNDIECSERVIENWLFTRGYTRTEKQLVALQKGKLIRKSNKWLYKNCKVFFDEKGTIADICEELTRIEDNFKNKFE
jgi:hypothetical protein